MDKLEELSLNDIKRGFGLRQETGCYICAVCGKAFEAGEVFSDGGRYFDAEHMVGRHVREAHGGMFASLLSLDKKETTLTDNQKELLRMIYAGASDKTIAAKTGVAASTVRHQRFMFREKMRQAKIFLCICELALEKQPRGDELIDIHEGAKMVDDRYLVTKTEEEAILSNMFSSLSPLRLKTLSPKEKKKIVILRKISEQFSRDRKYKEKEVNAILKDIYEDFATIRRYLIEYGFMERDRDGSEYWRKS